MTLYPFPAKASTYLFMPSAGGPFKALVTPFIKPVKPLVSIQRCCHSVYHTYQTADSAHHSVVRISAFSAAIHAVCAISSPHFVPSLFCRALRSHLYDVMMLCFASRRECENASRRVGKRMGRAEDLFLALVCPFWTGGSLRLRMRPCRGWNPRSPSGIARPTSPSVRLQFAATAAAQVRTIQIISTQHRYRIQRMHRRFN